MKTSAGLERGENLTGKMQIELHSAILLLLESLSEASDDEMEVFTELFVRSVKAADVERSEYAAALAQLAISAGSTLVDASHGISRSEKEKLVQYRKGVGEAIRTRRIELGWTQGDLAARSGIPQSHISRLENGQHTPSYLTMESLAQSLRVDRKDLDPGFEDEN